MDKITLFLLVCAIFGTTLSLLLIKIIHEDIEIKKLGKELYFEKKIAIMEFLSGRKNPKEIITIILCVAILFSSYIVRCNSSDAKIIKEDIQGLLAIDEKYGSSRKLEMKWIDYCGPYTSAAILTECFEQFQIEKGVYLCAASRTFNNEGFFQAGEYLKEKK